MGLIKVLPQWTIRRPPERTTTRLEIAFWMLEYQTLIASVHYDDYFIYSKLSLNVSRVRNISWIAIYKLSAYMIENYTDVIKLSVLYVSRVCVTPGCRANQMHLPAEHRVVARGKHSPEQSIGASSHHWHRTETALRGVRSGAAARHILPSIRAEANGHLAVGARRTAPRGCLPCPNGAAGQGFGVSRAVFGCAKCVVDGLMLWHAPRARAANMCCVGRIASGRSRHHRSARTINEERTSFVRWAAARSFTYPKSRFTVKKICFKRTLQFKTLAGKRIKIDLTYIDSVHRERKYKIIILAN